MNRFATWVMACMGTSLLVHGQQSITAINTAVSQNFNGMATSTSATLPTGWKVGSDWASGTTTSTAAFGTSGTGVVISSSASAGAINWADGITGSASDRSLGFRNGNTSTGARNLVYAFKNDTAVTIRSINLAWRYEKYISGTAPMSWTFFHGSGSTASIPESSGDQVYAADANNSTVSTPVAVINESVSLSNLSIAPGATYYLRWNYNNTGTPTGWMGQGLGIDDFSITLVPTIQFASSMTSFATTLGIASAAQSFTYELALAGNMTVTAPTGFEVSSDGNSWSTTLSVPASSVSGTLYARIASTALLGSPSGNISLAATGATTMNVPVSGTVVRSTDASLSGLTLSAGTLSPSFGGSTLNYSTTVPAGTASVTVTATASNIGATLRARVNGAAYSSITSGNPSSALSLNDGTNTVNVQVTAQDTSTVRTYAITVVRPGVPTLGSVDLASRTATSISMSGNVAAENGSSITERGFVYSVNSVNPTPTAGGTGVTKVAHSGTPSAGAFTTLITGLQPGTSYAYRAYAINGVGTGYSVAGFSFTTMSTDAGLSSLTLGGVTPAPTLSPTFQSATTSYSTTVASTAGSVTVTASPRSSGATVKVRVNGAAYADVTNGIPSGAMSLQPGANTLDVSSTAEDGSAALVYSIAITRRAAPVLGLPTSASITGTSATLGGIISTDNGDTIIERGVVYSLTSVNNMPRFGEVGVVKLQATGTGVGSPFTVSATALTAGTSYTFRAYAINGSGTTFSGAATFTTLSADASLAGLAISAGGLPRTLSPAFSPVVAVYSTVVPSTITEVRVTPTAMLPGTTVRAWVGTNAPIMVPSETESGGLPVLPGPNNVTVESTAPDGVTKRNYSVTVTRQTSPSVDSPTAAFIDSTAATLGGRIWYDGGAAVTERGVVYALSGVNGDPVIGGNGVQKAMSGPGTGLFEIRVSGLQPVMAYSYRAYAINDVGITYSSTATFTTLGNEAVMAGLYLETDFGFRPPLVPSFDSATLEYTATVGASAHARSVFPQWTVKPPFKSLQTTVWNTPLSPGASVSTVAVTSEDGRTTRTYKVTVTSNATGYAPQGKDRAVSVSAGGTYTFDLADWGFSDDMDPPPDVFSGVRITTLPGAGVITADTNSVAAAGTVNAATSWSNSPRMTSQGWTSIAASADGSRLAAAATGSPGGSIWTASTWEGDWTQRTAAGTRDWTCIASSADGARLVAAANNDRVYVSADGGATWTARITDANRGWVSVASSSDGSRLAAVARGGVLFISSDSGATWTPRSVTTNHWAGIASSSDGLRLAAVASNDDVYLSTNGGSTWTAAGEKRGWRGVAMSADGSQIVGIVSGTGPARISRDFGVTWIQTGPTRINAAAVAMSSNGSRILVAESYPMYTGGRVFLSLDRGVTWMPIGNIQSDWKSMACSADGFRVFGVASGPPYAATLPLTRIQYAAPTTAGTRSFTFQVRDNGIGNTMDPTPRTMAVNVVSITPGSASLTGFAASPGGFSVPSPLSFSSAGLGEPLTVTASGGWEVSTDGTVYKASVSYPATTTSGTVQVRMRPDSSQALGTLDGTVSFASGAAKGEPVTLTGTVYDGPRITAQPAGTTVALGRTAVLTVTATSSSGAMTYQWRKDGLALSNGARVSGATSATLTLSGVEASDAGQYTVEVRNTAGPTLSEAATLSVVPFNNPPTLGAIGNLTRLEDSAASVVALSGIGDGDGGTQALTVTAMSSNPSVVPHPTVTYTSGQAAGSLALTSPTNANGSATITVRVQDNGGTVSGAVDIVEQTFVVTVTPVNDAPTLSAIGDVTLLGTGLWTAGSRSMDFGTPISGGDAVRGSASRTTTGNGEVTLTTTAGGQTGSFAMADLNPGLAVRAFRARFRLLIDAGGIFPAEGASFNFMGEDPATASMATAELGMGTGLSVGFAVGGTPAVVLRAGNVEVGRTNYQAHGVGTLSSMPWVEVTLFHDRTVSVLHNGVLLFDRVATTLQPTAGWRFAWSARTSISGSARHVIDDISVSTATAAASVPVPIAGVSDGDGGGQALTVTATTSNATLLAAPTVQYTSPQATGALVFAAPVTNASGTATITVRVQDNGGTANGGLNFVTRSFQASVVAVNNPPTLDAVANLRVDSGSGQQSIVNLTGIGAGGEPGQAVTLSASSGNTSLVSSVAVEYTPGATTAQLRIATVSGASGTAVVYVTAKDDGGTDNLGSDTSMRAFTVTAGVLPPVIVAGPTHRFVEVGQASTLTVSATGFGLGYKWFKNGVEVGGATAPSLTIPSMSASDAATYRVQVSNSNPEGVNPTAEVHVGMVSMPARQAARAGAAVTLSAQVTAPQGVAVTRQWLRGDEPVTGGLQDALTLSPVGPATAGDYALRLRMGGTDFVTAPVSVRLVAALPGLFSTGVDDSGVRLRDRQEDPHYDLVSPSPVLGRPVAVVTPGQFPTPPWVVGGATSAWISPTVRLREAGSDSGTPYTYRTTFDLTGIDLGSVRLAGSVAADDGLVAMRLNGVDLPLPSGVGPGDFKTFDVSVPNLRGADRFADRGTLPSAGDVAGSADTTGASMETGEEMPGTALAHGKVGSVWWRWVAPTNGVARVSSTGSAIPVILAVYRGRAMGSLTLLGSSDGGGADAATVRAVEFAATAGQEYHLYMDGHGDAAGLVRVELRLTGQGPTGQDNFASRGVLPAWAWRATAAGTNVGATYEAGEPVASGTTATEYHTLWWTWTAPASGEVTFDTIGSGIDTVLWVYTGTAVGSLTQVTSNDDIGAGNTASRATFTAVSGTSYHLRVDGKASATGALVLNLTRGTQPTAQEGGLTVLPGRNDLDFVVRNLADAGTDRSLTGLRVELGQSEAVVHPAWLVAGPVGGLGTFGTRTALSVSAVSAGATRFQWYKNDAPLDGANEATLEFNRLEEDDAGRYRVRVDNLNGTTWSDPVDLAVDVPLTITQQPVDQAVVVGGSASFGVRYRGNPPFAVQWMFNGQPIAGATSATLTISPAALSSEGVYRAAVTDREGSVETDEAVLRVMQPPLIVQQPGDVSGVEGVGTLRLEAVVDGTELLQCRWFRNDVPLAVGSGPVLDLGLMRESQEGAYRLVVTNLVGAVTSRVAQVTVNQRPSVVADTGNQNVNVGEDATFGVTATGSGTLEYRWYVAGTLVPGASQASLTLSQPPAQTGTEVMAVVSSAHGSATNKVRLDVFPAPEPVVSTGGDIVQTLTLRPGWNAVFLHVQPEDNRVGSVFTNIPFTSVWRWSDPGVGPEFIADQSEGQIDFQKWQVFLPPSHPASFQNNLVRVFRHEAYLVNLGGTQTVTLTLSGKPAYMRRRWISDGYTLTGFPVAPAMPNPDAAGQFLPGVALGDFIASSTAHYDAVASAPRGVYRLGVNGAWAPMASADELREGEAYWVYTRGASQFIAPLELSMQGLSEITFGVGTVTQELEVRAAGADGDASEMPTTISHVISSQSLPLQVSEFNPSEGNRWRDLQNGYPIPATRGSVRTVRLAAKRERIRDLAYEGVMEVRGGGALHRVPLRVDRDRAEVTADPSRPFNPVGLWLGSVTVTHVSEVNGLTTNYLTTVVTNVVDGVARRVEQPTTDVRNVTVGSRPTPVRDSFEMRVILHVGADGVCRLLQQATLLTKPTTGDASNPGGEPVLLTSPASFSKYQGVAMRGRDLVGRRFSTPFYPMPGTNGVPFDSTLGPGRTVTARWALPSDAALNPFKHRYHPDHDNLDASFRVFREEAYPVRRTVRLKVPAKLGSNVNPGLGQDELQGEYEEVLDGLHRLPITVRGTFQIKRLLAVADLDPASP